MVKLKFVDFNELYICTEYLPIVMNLKSLYQIKLKTLKTCLFLSKINI
jgi:hypothetical protein